MSPSLFHLETRLIFLKLDWEQMMAQQRQKKKPKYKSSNFSGRSCFQQWRWLCHAAKASLRSVITTNLMACNNYFWVFSFLMKANIWACHWFNCFLFLTRQQYMNGVIFTVFHQDICCVYFVF